MLAIGPTLNWRAMIEPGQPKPRRGVTARGVITLAGVLPIVLPIVPLLAQPPAFPLAEFDDPAVIACTALSELALPELGSIAADWMPRGPAALPDREATATGTASPPIELAEHCRVRGRIEPAIDFEVWLPSPAAWNGRFLAVGGSDYAGTISYGRMAPRLNDGYATASTDTGHEADGFGWLADDALLRDFAYRAIYEMTSKARVIVARFYERPADYRYFNGCSLGGRQGLMEAQRFPADYDGIVAGAPVNAFIDTRTTQLWATRASHPVAGGQPLLRPDVLERVAAAATAQCDTLDGVADGVIEDPRRCNFDPARLQCGAPGPGDPGVCLAGSEVAALADVYRGPTHPDTGPIAPGFAVGSEAGWTFVAAPEPSPVTLEFFRRAVFDDPLWNWRSFDFALDHAYAVEELRWMLDATSADLSEYRDRGGKLLLYHGWNDANNSPEATIAYYEEIETALAVEPNPLGIRTRDFARLFLVPGMGHCGGGPGTTEFDAQRAIEDWVERGIAPDRIEAERVEDGRPVRTRPLCPYPETARYRGTGNSDRSGSFLCAQ
ncbi:MAG TPA: tannase/feruloyl esterase family alpha/beta hydrolase [Gammaproteobacteria bacterium]|nr:tannase/feruloyl esterase family alpha/beta hydrolase [Gammaproteobacteria bacterium]